MNTQDLHDAMDRTEKDMERRPWRYRDVEKNITPYSMPIACFFLDDDDDDDDDDFYDYYDDDDD